MVTGSVPNSFRSFNNVARRDVSSVPAGRYNLPSDVYSHVLPGMQEEAAERVDKALRTALSNGSQIT